MKTKRKPYSKSNRWTEAVKKLGETISKMNDFTDLADALHD